MTSFFLFNFSSHYHFYIVRNLFTNRDDFLQNLGETTVVACKMFTSGFRPNGSKNVLSSSEGHGYEQKNRTANIAQMLWSYFA